jgi:Uma2 family endonuclease
MMRQQHRPFTTDEIRVSRTQPFGWLEKEWMMTQAPARRHSVDALVSLRRRGYYRMAMAASAKRWTADEVRLLPDDGKRYEVIDGELFVNPSPTWSHQRASRALLYALESYARLHTTIEVIDAPADVRFADETMVQPDLFVIPFVEGRRPETLEEAGRLLLAVEILSPGSARTDRQIKRRLYQREGVGEYWIVDLDGRVIERWRPGDDRPEILTERIDWSPAPEHDPLTIDLRLSFARVLGD